LILLLAQKLFLQNFRNYIEAEVEFSDGVNIIYGKNGAGKTNLIEALYTFSYARSFRAPAREFVRHGEKITRMALFFESENRNQSADMVFSKDNRRKIRVNEIEIKKTSSMLGKFISVLFTPDELNLVKGGPEHRRRFLDSALTAIKPGYLTALGAYHTAVKQKNALLREEKYETEDIWNEKLAEYGARVVFMREKYIDLLSKKGAAVQSEISGGKEKLDVLYQRSYRDGKTEGEIKDAILNKISEIRLREHEQHMSLAGPHRDDVLFKINGENARQYASQGQNRSIVLSMKTAQLEIIKEDFDEYPILLLDDVLSELDSERREFFTGKIKGRQVIITSTDTEKIGFGENVRLIRVEDGKICM